MTSPFTPFLPLTVTTEHNSKANPLKHMRKFLSPRLHKRLAIVVAVVVLSSVSLPAAVLYNEGVSGDLSNNQLAPTARVPALGINSVLGTVFGGGDSQDWISLSIPAGLQLSSVVLAAYAAADAQGFTGFTLGGTFPGDTFNPASYLGYSHFGTFAQNGSYPPINLVGQDILPIMHDPVAAPGSLGFPLSLPSGTYTFLIQQLGASTSYQFDYVLTAVPEPGSLALLGCGILLLARRRLRR
jgi:hypothetical protein